MGRGAGLNHVRIGELPGAGERHGHLSDLAERPERAGREQTGYEYGSANRDTRKEDEDESPYWRAEHSVPNP